MLPVTDLKVRSLDVDFHELSWSLGPTTEDVLDYEFLVLRAESVAGPWDQIGGPFTDRYVFRDYTNRPFHNARTFQYLLRATNRVTGASSDFGPVDGQPEADLVCREIRRQFQLLFREHSGRRCWLLPVRTFGQRCKCWNPRLNKPTRSGCRLCYDTGFVRGYHNPIEIWAQVEPGSSQVEQPTPALPAQPTTTTARIVDVGNVRQHDILIEGDNRRWRVERVDTVEHVRAPVLFDLVLHQIPKSDVEYAIELDLGVALRDLWLAPARNFTNPHNLAAFEREETPGIFSLYPTTYTDPGR